MSPHPKWAIKEHFENEHMCKPTHKLLEENTNVIVTKHLRFKLAIKEAVYILNINIYK